VQNSKTPFGQADEQRPTKKQDKVGGMVFPPFLFFRHLFFGDLPKVSI